MYAYMYMYSTLKLLLIVATNFSALATSTFGGY